MKIIFTGGGSGGHFYPIIAIAEKIRKIVAERRLLQPKFYFASNDPYDLNALVRNDIEFLKVPAGKMRRYFSLENAIDVFKTATGFFFALFKVFRIYPDVIFSKGGFASMPIVLAGKVWGIPIIVHESDSVPGRANKFAGKFAKRVALSYSEAAEYFPKKNTAWTGQPIRSSIKKHPREEAEKFLRLEPNIPTILVLGGSSGAEKINDLIVSSLSELLNDYQIIHQTGKANLEEVKGRASLLDDETKKSRYHPFGSLDDEALSMSAGVSDLIISRAGSTIFEIAYWAIPSIIVPISDSNGDHQKKNAYNYSLGGASVSIEESNLNKIILLMEVKKILSNPEVAKRMSDAAKMFFKGDADTKIAEEILRIGLSHE